jgi:hypothetical protein
MSVCCARSHCFHPAHVQADQPLPSSTNKIPLLKRSNDGRHHQCSSEEQGREINDTNVENLSSQPISTKSSFALPILAAPTTVRMPNLVSGEIELLADGRIALPHSLPPKRCRRRLLSSCSPTILLDPGPGSHLVPYNPRSRYRHGQFFAVYSA